MMLDKVVWDLHLVTLISISGIHASDWPQVIVQSSKTREISPPISGHLQPTDPPSIARHFNAAIGRPTFLF